MKTFSFVCSDKAILEVPTVNIETCGHCKERGETIRCHGCGREIIHSKNSYSIGHRCLECNIEDGKGE